MAVFPKVMQEVGGGAAGVDLKGTLDSVLKQRKMREMDEAAIDRTVQAEVTKTAELEAKEVEAHKRKVDAEVGIMDRMIPQGIVGLLTELIKDKNPQQPLTVEDMLAILEYAKGQQQGGYPTDQPPDGMWGFLGTMMTALMANNKTVTPLELIQSIQQVNTAMRPQQQQQGNLVSQFTELASLMQVFKGLFAPPSHQFNPADLVNMPGGGVMTFDNLMKWQEQGFNLQLKRDEYDEKKQNWKTGRENVPALIGAISEFAAAIKGEGGIGKKEAPPEQSGREQVPPQSEKQELVCPECGLPFIIPAGIEGEVACPKCSMEILRKLEEGSHVQNVHQGQGESEGPGADDPDRGADDPGLPGKS